MNWNQVFFAFSMICLAGVAYLSGILGGIFGWFPSGYVTTAIHQAYVLNASLYVHPRMLETRVYDHSGVRIHDSESTAPGYTLIATFREEFNWDPGLILIDSRGNVVHRWHIPQSDLFPAPPPQRTRRTPEFVGTNGSHLFEDGDILVNVSYVGVARLDACGNVEWTLPRGNHHSIHPTDEGTFWIPSGRWVTTDTPVERPQIHERVGTSTYRGSVMEVNARGKVLREIELIPVLFKNDLQRYLVKGSQTPRDGPPGEDLLHLNDVEPLPRPMADEYPDFQAGDLLVSLKRPNLVFVMDPETGTVRWYAHDPFIQQHDPDFLGDGWIGIFDNNRDGTHRGTFLGGSRVVYVQPHTGRTKVPFPTPQSDPFYTHNMGEFQRLPNGNFLLVESAAGRVVEVNPNGKTVWEWFAPEYDSNRVPEVADARRYDIDPSTVASWPCNAIQSSDRGGG